ncbi:phage tail protein [Phaeobacter sp. B1627]|uniref:phage tail protein n=1 Tax=Phaeobacter sp. B1627 TaxID=2583809 RepID=UPI001118228A|nr:tail fiber protein [Phaeobacter sp. B1627]TNJ39619.1 phage tail protein [Phaeobacter sp. B1627]
MSEPFLAEVRMVGFNFPPRGWALCDGQILPINQNQSLYSLLGTTYGGDGRTSFALPDLRGRTPVHPGNGHRVGQKSGEETHALSVVEMPQHTHEAMAIGKTANSGLPAGNMFAQELDPDFAYSPPAGGGSVALRSGTITNAGGGQAHNNMQPYTTVNFCIALQGLFPSRN